MAVAAWRERIHPDDELAAPPDDGQRYEIIGGELIASPAPALTYQRVAGNFSFALRRFVDAHPLGDVIVAPAHVKFSPHNEVEPDVLFTHRDRRAIMHPQFVAGASDLVLELLSASSRRRDLVQKRALYAMAGVPEYWLIDPTTRTFTHTFSVLALVDEQYTPLAPDDTGRHNSGVLPGFGIDPIGFFNALLP